MTGAMNFAVESWDPSYGVSADETAMGEASNPVDLGLEVRSDDWTPIQPADDVEPPTSVLFVDGVRRIDARVWITGADGRAYPGVCATVAAGAVRCRADSARVAVARVERALYTAAPEGGPIVTSCRADSARVAVARVERALYTAAPEDTAPMNCVRCLSLLTPTSIRP